MFRAAGFIIVALTLGCALGQVSAELAKPVSNEDAIAKDFIRPEPLPSWLKEFQTLNSVPDFKTRNKEVEVSSPIKSAQASSLDPELTLKQKGDSDESSDSDSDSASEEDPESFSDVSDPLKKLIVKVKVKVKVNKDVKRKIKVKCVDKF